jgi:hypothetical protein
MINLIQDSEPLGWVLNPGHLEQRAGVLPTPINMASSVQNTKFYSVHCADFCVNNFASSNNLKLNCYMRIQFFWDMTMCQFFQNLATNGDHGIIFLQNNGIWLPRDAVSYPRTEASATLLWQFKACKIFTYLLTPRFILFWVLFSIFT